MPTPTLTIGNDLNFVSHLFETDIHDQVLLSCHLLGKPNAAQLYRLHRESVSGLRQMQQILYRLTHTEELLAMIKPIEIEHPSRILPALYLDTTKGRRHLEKTYEIPFRRPPKLPSRDWRFLRHDNTYVDELVSTELTARKRSTAFGHVPHFDSDGVCIYPRVTIQHDDLTHTLRPRPDGTLIIGDYGVIDEHDCGEETIELSNIIRDATIGRKHLVYDQLIRSGALDGLGVKKVIWRYIIDGKKCTKMSSRKRLKRCIQTIPAGVDAKRIFFVDRQTFIEAGDDTSALEWMRGDGERQVLPCWKSVKHGR